MNIINGSIILSELSKELGIGSANIRQAIYKNRGNIADNINKWENRKTGDYLIDCHSALSYIEWCRGKSRKITEDNLNKVENEIKLWLQNH